VLLKVIVTDVGVASEDVLAMYWKWLKAKPENVPQ
jgi:hypothetical protein